MKRTNPILALLCVIAAAIVLTLSVAGCSNAPAPTEAEVTESATKAPTDAPTDAPTEADDKGSDNSSPTISSLNSNKFKLKKIEPVKVADNTIHVEFPTLAKFHIDTFTIKTKSDIDLDINEETGEITLPANTLFSSDSATISSEAKKELKKFIDAYTESVLASKDEVNKIIIEGHTDTDGSHEYNQTLSEKRANAVKEYCLELHPELKDYLVAKGCSYDKPIYKSNGEVDKAASRRVVFRVE